MIRIAPDMCLDTLAAVMGDGATREDAQLVRERLTAPREVDEAGLLDLVDEAFVHHHRHA